MPQNAVGGQTIVFAAGDRAPVATARVDRSPIARPGTYFPPLLRLPRGSSTRSRPSCRGPTCARLDPKPDGPIFHGFRLELSCVKVTSRTQKSVSRETKVNVAVDLDGGRRPGRRLSSHQIIVLRGFPLN